MAHDILSHEPTTKPQQWHRTTCQTTNNNDIKAMKVSTYFPWLARYLGFLVRRCGGEFLGGSLFDHLLFQLSFQISIIC